MPDADALDCITLKGMRFHTLVGILPHEREHPQPLEVDVTAMVRRSDGGVMDYRHVYEAVRASIDAPPLRYLEALADAIATRLLQHASVRHVRVAVRKPHAAIGGPLDYVEVAVQRNA